MSEGKYISDYIRVPRPGCCLICVETPGWVFINDPQEAKPVKKRCPRRCPLPEERTDHE